MGAREAASGALRAPIEVHVEAPSKARPEAVYRALADLQAHLEWGGRRRPEKMRLLSMEAPAGLATAGTEFTTTGSDPRGTFSDRSVVTEAAAGRVFEFVTEAMYTPAKKGNSVAWTIVHRYEIAAAPEGSTISYGYRVTSIGELNGPLRLLRTPLAGVLKAAWAALSRRGLRSLADYAATLPSAQATSGEARPEPR